MAATRLFVTATVEEQWQALAGPWLRAQAAVAWKNPRPTVILTPSRPEGFYLRSRLVAEGAPYLGLRFWTPSDARKFLLAEISPELAATSRAEERLIARACAENLAEQTGPENAAITSVIREPGAFLRAYDLLLGAGWNPARAGAEYGRDLARDLQRVLQKSRVATQAGLHLGLRRKGAGRPEPLIANLLVIGFNATHWPLWDLLQAAVHASEQADVGLLNPRFFAEAIDQLWINSWEEITKSVAVAPIEPIGLISPIQSDAPFSDLIASYEKGTPGQSAGTDFTFLVTPDLTSQVRAITLQAIGYLKQYSCTRLGIIFAEANALALGVAGELRRLGIQLDDGIGLTSPGLFERRSWHSWLALQEEPGVPALIAWLRACEAEGVSPGVQGQLTARDVASILDGALGESLVDDLNFLALHLESSNRTNAGHVADFLRRRVVLPERTTFARFLELTRRAADIPGWENHLARLKIDPPAWLLGNDQVFSRRAFLEWLKETTASQAWTSGGNHFYGKVHLLIYAQMSGQTWSHLILTGLNEGVWPRVYEAGAFGSRHELVELNRQARALNVRSIGQGGQGSGHETVSAGHGYCLLPLERQDLALRDLCAALDSTSHAASLAAMTTEGGRSLLPSDFFNHAWQSKTGHVLDEETFRNLANKTADWCEQHESLFSTTPSTADESLDDLPLFAQPPAFNTATAYHARRESGQPFGPYEFAYARPPARPIQLTCKRWEDALSHPATVWLEEIIGTSSWPDGTMSWQRAIGTWTHRWLASALREWQETNSAPAELPVLIWAAADREAQAVHRRAREVDIELYPWWEQVWAQARAVALGLGETLMPVLPERPFLCELRLPRNLMIALPGTALADFSLNGRIDLLLLDPGATPPDPVEPDLSRRTCWVIDFKTGSAQSLNAKKMAEGKGLQPILYALAAQALGAVATSISLHTVDAPLKPQVQLDNIVEVGAIFRSLEIFHREGVFGMRADAENAYGYAPSYPMATRFIPSSILEAKWTLVHGGVFAGGDDA